jgi:hypothetical protein
MTSTYADHLRRHGFPGNRGDCWWPEGGRSGVTITELDVDARRADLLEAWLRKKRADILVVAMPDAGRLLERAGLLEPTWPWRDRVRETERALDTVGRRWGIPVVEPPEPGTARAR